MNITKRERLKKENVKIVLVSLTFLNTNPSKANPIQWNYRRIIRFFIM